MCILCNTMNKTNMHLYSPKLLQLLSALPLLHLHPNYFCSKVLRTLQKVSKQLNITTPMQLPHFTFPTLYFYYPSCHWPATAHPIKKPLLKLHVSYFMSITIKLRKSYRVLKETYFSGCRIQEEGASFWYSFKRRTWKRNY